MVVEIHGDPAAELEIVLREVLHPALAPLPLRYRLAMPAGRRRAVALPRWCRAAAASTRSGR